MYCWTILAEYGVLTARMFSISFRSIGIHVLLVGLIVFGQVMTSTLTTETSVENIQTKAESFTFATDGRTTYASQGSSPESSDVSGESTTRVSPSSIPQRSLSVSEEIRTYVSDGSIPERSAAAEESTTYVSKDSIRQSLSVLEERTSYGTQGSIPESSAFSEESTTYGSPRYAPMSLLFLAVFVGTIVLIYIIFIIVITLGGRKRFRKESCHSQLNSNFPQSNNAELDSIINMAPVDTSVNEHENAPVESSDDIRGDHKDIPFSTFKQSEDGATNQQPGKACVSLECQKEPIKLEPHEKSDHTTAPTNIAVQRVMKLLGQVTPQVGPMIIQ